jgi:very-short-patch-repair endonuclease
VLACGIGAVLSHGSAASLWKYVRDWSLPLEVTAKSDRRRPGITVHPATKRLQPFIDPSRAGGPTRSEFEDAFIEFARRYELPAPITNTELHGYEIDALFPAERVIVELDGAEFHLDREVFESDRERDAALLEAGYVTIRIAWERLKGQPAREAARLRKILDARRRRVA